MKKSDLHEKLRNNLGQLLEGLRLVEAKEDVLVRRGAQHVRADMLATIKVGAKRKKLIFELKQRSYPHDLEQGISQLRKMLEYQPEFIPILVAPFFSESGRRLLRAQGINYVDLSGNAYISFDNVLIHKTSPINAYKHKKEGINIFMDKASLTLRELIAKPDEYQTVRGLAKSTLSSIGWTSEVLQEIEKRGYLDRKSRQGCHIRRIEHLLNDWTDAYDFLGKNKFRRFFVKADSLEEILGLVRKLEMPSEVDYALTLHGGAYLVAPFVQFNECHLYVSAQKDFDRQIEFFAKELGLIERDVGGNFHIALPYYRESAFFQARIIKGLKVVSDLQLYLDLYGFPIRGKEQALKVLERSGLPYGEGWA